MKEIMGRFRQRCPRKIVLSDCIRGGRSGQQEVLC